jgi:hypothetical protein
MIGDIIAVDRDDQAIMIVEVKPWASGHEEFDAFVDQFLGMAPRVPFGMFVDLEDIRIVSRMSATPRIPVACLKTVDVLKDYSPDFAGKDSRYGSRQSFQDYLRTLVGSWLRDFAFHWKNPDPPGFAEFARIGLAERLEGGMTQSDVTVVVSPLH